MARDVKVAILADARDFERATSEVIQGAQRMESAFDRAQQASVTNASHLRRNFDDTNDSIRRTGDEVDRTGSVFANFAGNAVQDLPGISGSFGALNVAAGQFAEYATEGGIAIRKFAMALGPIALGTVAIQKISEHFQKIAAARAFQRDQVKGWVDEMKEGATAVEAMVESAREAGKLEIRLFNDVVDIVPGLDALGLSLEDFARLTQASAEQLAAWRQEMMAAGHDNNSVVFALEAVSQAQEQQAKATEQAALQERVFGESVEESTRAISRNTYEVERSQRAMESRVEHLRDSWDATNALFEAEIAHRDAQRRSIAAQFAVNDAIAEHGRRSWQAREAIDAAATAMNDQSLAAVRIYEETARLNGVTLENGRLADIQRQALVNMRDEVSGPLARAIDEHIARLGRVPVDITTTIGVRTVLESETNRDDQIARNLSDNSFSKSGQPISIEITGVGSLEVAREVERAVTWATN